MASDNKEVATEVLPILRVYNDGSVDRLLDLPTVPPSSDEDPTTGVSSKDITISPEVSARLYLPKLTHTTRTLPILVYFHGGAFCVGSAYALLCHNFINSLVSQAKALAVSVEYRLAPEHPLPAAYEDCWAALQWVASNYVASNITNSEPWLIDHGDYDRVYIGGDSAGGNIVHNIAMRASTEHITNDIKIMGGFACFPYFLGSKPIGSELSKNHEQSLLYRFWMVAYPSARGGIDNPMMNPWAEDAPSLSGLACSRLLVCVGEKDKLRDRGVRYCEELRKSAWNGEVELVEIEGEDHCFHIFNPGTENAKNLVKRLASFIM